MKYHNTLLLVLALCVAVSAVGCQFTRNGEMVNWGDMTLQEQMDVAERGLQLAREAYWTYMEYVETRNVEPDPARVDSLERRVARYIDIVEQIQQALQPAS